MSSSMLVRYADTDHSPAVQRPRSPASTDRATACSRGGSDEKALGTRHGSAGSAQLSSAAVGARFDSA